MPVTALPVITPVPLMLTVMSATVPVKPADGMTWKVISRICLGEISPTYRDRLPLLSEIFSGRVSETITSLRSSLPSVA